jgi:uncharacterized membrane protein
VLREAVNEAIRKRHPDWSPHDSICHACLDIARSQYVQDALEAERGELSSLEQEVVKTLETHSPISADTNAEFDEKATFGQRIADRMADVAGSWGFIISFGVVLLAWISVNALALLGKAFDPFPFILLNLVLSCLAAIQAPIIMMSQNRQEARDRLRAEHDYQVNLKAELEIKQLHEKVDHIMVHQWQRPTEIQQIQVDLMDELMKKGA